jgi:holdfast attachment protein HfaA
MVQARLSKVHGVRRLALYAAVALVGLPGMAAAQTMTTNSASFNAGYGRTAGEENRPVNVTATDANGNLTIVNGQVQNSSSFLFAGASANAAAGAEAGFSGVGGSSTAIGNNLNVVTQGNNNTVIVSSIQTNTGNVSATTNTSGKP